MKAETHKSIRIGAVFEKIVNNILQFLELRAKRNGKTRVVIRFTAQKQNIDEWKDFKNQWLKRLDDTYNDVVFFMRVHSWGDGNELYHSQDVAGDKAIYICSDFLTKEYVFADGSVAFCCSDYNGFFNLGNAVIDDPIQIYNKPIFSKYRKYMKTGRIKELDLCKKCSIPMSRCNIAEYSPNGNVKRYEISEHLSD